MRRYLAAAVIILAAAHAAAATPYYVNASTGNDTTGNGTVGTPWKTIKKGMAVATSGDIIYVAAGTYDTTNGETFPITVKSGVQLIGAGATTTIIDANGANTRVIVCSGNSATTLIQSFTI